MLLHNNKTSLVTLFLIVISCILVLNLQAQKESYDIACVGFYNLENLFDTLDHPDKNDQQFTPTGSYNWTLDKYEEKLDNMAKVISMMGRQKTKEGVAILGVAEIENKKVLEDLVNHPRIKARDYGIVHYESPDNRGIDVGLLYQKNMYRVATSKRLRLKLYQPDSTMLKTRDILLVSGALNGDSLHFLVNHWPSRRGGESRSKQYRNAAAQTCKMVTDSIMQANPSAKVIIMGDLNDDPNSESVNKILAAKPKKKDLKKSSDLFNTMYTNYKKGNGSNAYRDSWSLFDQIIISKNLIDKSDQGYFHFQTEIFNPSFLIQKTGRYKSYPKRTYSFGKYIGGFSDHFPVFIYLIKKAKLSKN